MNCINDGQQPLLRTIFRKIGTLSSDYSGSTIKLILKITGALVLVLSLGLAPAGADELLGIEDDGDIYRFTTDPGSCSATFVADANAGSAEHNALGYDQTNQRIYFATFPVGCPSPAAELFFWDLTDPGGSPKAAGTLTGCAANAEFDKGVYYYVDDGTDDLYRVSFLPNGTMSSEVKVADVFSDGETLFFGDVAIRNDDHLFGRAADSGAYSSFLQFEYDLVANTPPADSDVVSSLLQTSFGADGTTTLFGISTGTNEVFTLDQGDGTAIQICNTIQNGGPFTDTAGFRPVIDVKPGSDPSCFNINGRGSIPVAIFGSSELDVTDIEQNTLEFGGMPVTSNKKGPKCSIKDVDDDGEDDLVCHFEDDGNFTEDAPGTGCVTGEFVGGEDFTFCNDICLSGRGN